MQQFAETKNFYDHGNLKYIKIIYKIILHVRCLFWKRDGVVVPESMSTEEEKGLAKLLVEQSEETLQVDSIEVSADVKSDLRLVNENTPQVTTNNNYPPLSVELPINTLNKHGPMIFKLGL